MDGRLGTRRCGSAPDVGVGSAEPSRGVRVEFSRVPQDDEGAAGDSHRTGHSCLFREVLRDVTFDCLLFVCILSLMVLSMTTMTVVVLLHAVSGGKLFDRHDSRKNTTGDKPPFNFNT